MVAIRCIEMGDFGSFLWVTLSSRRTKLPPFHFLCSNMRPSEECTTKTVDEKK